MAQRANTARDRADARRPAKLAAREADERQSTAEAAAYDAGHAAGAWKMAGVSVGLSAAPALNARIPARPLGRYVPPSAAGSLLSIWGASLAHRARMPKTTAAAVGLGVGLAIGTLASAKEEGGILAPRRP